MVIDEAVLARTTGGRKVMGAQLEHLEEMSTRPGVWIQVIGFDEGVYPGGSRGHYILVELDDELPAVIYQEGLGSPVDTSAKDDLDRYRRAWRAVRAKALDPFKSRELIARYRSQLVNPSGHPSRCRLDGATIATAGGAPVHHGGLPVNRLSLNRY